MIYPPAQPKCHSATVKHQGSVCVREKPLLSVYVCVRMFVSEHVCVHACGWLCIYVGVGLCVGNRECDILALHLVQVVLSPQSPLETPEDRESSFYVRLHINNDNRTHTSNKFKVSYCFNYCLLYKTYNN